MKRLKDFLGDLGAGLFWFGILLAALVGVIFSALFRGRLQGKRDAELERIKEETDEQLHRRITKER